MKLRSGYLSNGNGSFIKIAELLTHRPRFVDTNGEFQVRHYCYCFVYYI